MQFCKGEDGVKAFREKLQPFRETLQDYLYLGGSSPSYADMYLFGFFMVRSSFTPFSLYTLPPVLQT